VREKPAPGPCRTIVLWAGVICLVVSSAWVAASPVSGEPATLDDVIVTARGMGAPLSRTPGGAGTVDAQTILETAPTGVADAASRIPGVERSADSPWGADIVIRGMARNRIAVLVDGCRLNTATDINGRLGFVNPADIERIEVLKGPVSELYGSGTIGGVVNIITKKGTFSDTPFRETVLTGTVESNPRGTDGHAAAAYNGPGQWARLSAGYRDHDSYEAGGGDEISNSQFRDAAGMLSVGRRWNPAHTTELAVQYLEARNVGIPGRGVSLPTGPDVAYPRTGRTLVGLTHTFAPQGSLLQESRLNLYYQDVRRRVHIDHFPDGPVLETRPGADHHTWGMKWLNIAASEDHTVTAGIDIWHWEIDHTERTRRFANGQTGVDASLGDVSQLSAGIFAEDDWAAGDRFILNMGARCDGIEAASDDLYDWIVPPSSGMTPILKRDGGDETDMSWSAHIGATWIVTSVWSTTVLASSGYRAPDLLDRFKYINLGGGVSVYGNPNLDPERSAFFEVGLHANTPDLRFSAAAYANFLKDLIAERIVSDAVIRMENVDTARIMGAELDLEWFFHPDVSMYGNIAYADGRNTATDDPLPSIAPLNGLAGLRYDSGGGFWTAVETEWAAAQNDAPPGVETSDAWAVVNLRGGWRFDTAHTRQEFVIGIVNLLDRDYRNYLSTSRGIELKEPGRGVAVSWRVVF